jgi:hypothetical protein
MVDPERANVIFTGGKREKHDGQIDRLWAMEEEDN